ncbi:MAG: Peptide methionine sulfoxide reductase MsrB, partial [Candidatus Levybacteria bacterium GW2011_GWC2_40_7]
IVEREKEVKAFLSEEYFQLFGLFDLDIKAKLISKDEIPYEQKTTLKLFAGEYVYTKDDGMYRCIVCGNPLFDSSTKFESGSGWPSFYDIATKGNVILEEDKSLGMNRTEATCANCGAHLGHVFNDGPKEKTGLRYCINSCALDFQKG